MTDHLHEPFPGVMLWVDAEKTEMGRLMSRGQYEWRKVGYMRQHLQPGMTFVDVGAHVGYFTMLAASIVGASGQVVAFEPLKENFDRLINSRETNNLNQKVTLFQLALGSQTGDCNFYAGKHSGQWSLKPIAEVHTITYQARLDELPIGPIDMMKIDVEAAELEVLQGAIKTLANTRHILMDLHPELGTDPAPVQEILHNAGFRLFDIRSDFAPIETIPPTLVELLAVRQ